MATSNHNSMSLFLDRLLRRSCLTDADQQAVLNLKSHAHQVEARRDIVRPGEKVSHATLVVNGLAARFDQMRDGRRQFTALHLAGDMCDLHSTVAPVAGWGIEALTTTTVLYVPHSELTALVARNPSIALAFWRDTTADASILAKWVGNLGRRDARSRMAHLLCELGMRMEQAGLGTRTCYALHATQEQLSDVLGLTAVHVNRTLQALRADGLVRVENRTVHVDNWQLLADAAEFDETYLLVAPFAEQRAA